MPTTTKDTCLICLENFTLNAFAVGHGKCSGRFHSDCIKEWLDPSSTKEPANPALKQRFVQQDQRKDKCPACNLLYGGLMIKDTVTQG